MLKKITKAYQMTDITFTWRPCKRTSSALLKAGYSQDQLNKVGKTFIERYAGQILDDAGNRFSKMVRSSGSGHNVKPKADNGALKKILAKQEDKADNGEERAQEAKQNNDSEEMKRQMAAMVCKRWSGTSAEEAIKLFE